MTKIANLPGKRPENLSMTSLLPLPLSGLLTSQSVDWDERYVFDADGRVDAEATWKNGVKSVDMSMRPLPAIPPGSQKHQEVLSSWQIAERLLQPCPKTVFAALLTKLSLHFGMQDKAEGAIRSLFDDYWDDLGHYPEDLLTMACKKWRMNPQNKWFPRSGELAALMDEEYHRRKHCHERLAKLLEQQEQEARPKPAPEEEEARHQEILRGFEELRRKMTGKGETK